MGILRDGLGGGCGSRLNGGGGVFRLRFGIGHFNDALRAEQHGEAIAADGEHPEGLHFGGVGLGVIAHRFEVGAFARAFEGGGGDFQIAATFLQQAFAEHAFLSKFVGIADDAFRKQQLAVGGDKPLAVVAERAGFELFFELVERRLRGELSEQLLDVLIDRFAPAVLVPRDPPFGLALQVFVAGFADRGAGKRHEPRALGDPLSGFDEHLADDAFDRRRDLQVAGGVVRQLPWNDAGFANRLPHRFGQLDLGELDLFGVEVDFGGFARFGGPGLGPSVAAAWFPTLNDEDANRDRGEPDDSASDQSRFQRRRFRGRGRAASLLM